jgi:fimbrial isopeptide formation D2 family protein
VDPNITFTPVTPLITLSDLGGDDGFNDGLSINFGTISNPADGDLAGETIQIDFPARVRPTGNANGDDLTNTGTFSHATGGNVTGTTDINIVEPNLNITKAVSDASPDAGDTITYTIRVDHIDATSDADAFDLVITDTIPTGLTYAGNVTASTGPLPTVNATGSPTITFSYDDLTLVNDAYEFTFDATVNANVSPGQTIGNTASLTYDSLPADDDPFEKNYTDSALRNINIEAFDFSKTIISPTIAAALNATQPDINVGGTVTYRLSLVVPESTLTNLVLVDTLPDTFEAISGSLIQDNGVSHNFTAATLTDVRNADGINDTLLVLSNRLKFLDMK